MSEELKLLPCPFCGGKANTNFPELEGLYTIDCSDCYAGINYYDAPDEAIAAWNRRKEE